MTDQHQSLLKPEENKFHVGNGLAAVIGGTVGDVDTLVEASKIAAAKYVPILRDAQRRIEALEDKIKTLEGFTAAGTREIEALKAEVASCALVMRDLTEKSLQNKLRAEAAEALAAKMRKALVELSGFDYPTAEKIAIARAALDGDK